MPKRSQKARVGTENFGHWAKKRLISADEKENLNVSLEQFPESSQTNSPVNSQRALVV
jgi:hypothetical protein